MINVRSAAPLACAPQHNAALADNALCPINEVVLRWAGLVLGWVTACGQVNHIGMYPAAQVNSAFHPSGVGKWSTGLSGWG